MIQRIRSAPFLWPCFIFLPFAGAFYGLQGHTYVYNWSAILQVGVPELNLDMSSWVLGASVHITVLSGNSKSLLFEVKNFTSNITKSEYPRATPIIPETFQRKTTTEDFDFSFFTSLQDGEFRLSFPSTDEGYVGTRNANLCRGIANLFTLQRPVEGLGVAEFTVQENTVSGTCSTTYLVRPLNDRKAIESLDPSFCGRGILSEVVRTKNFDKCSVPVYYNMITPAGFRCDPGGSSCEGDFLRSSSTRFTICSIDSYAYPLDISNYNPFILSPWGVRTERAFAVTRQSALLVAIGNTADKNYSTRFGEETGESILFNFKAFSDSPRKAKLEKFMDFISNWKNGSKIIDPLEELGKGLIYYDKQDFDRVMRPEGKNVKSMQRKTLFYSLVAAGTESTVTYLADLLEEGALTLEEAIYFVSNLVMTVKFPEPRLLQRLVSLVESPFILNSSSLRKTALTSISSLVRMSCVSPSHARTRFPVAYHGPFCNSTNPAVLNMARVADKRLNEGPAKSDRIAALSALTTLGHEAVVPIIANFLTSKEAEDIELRTRAVLAFHRLAHAELPEVIGILYRVLTDYKEKDQVRMGAFTLFILSNPPIHRWFQLAVMTWYEPDVGVASFIYTSFRAMSKLESPLPLLNDLREKSTSVLRISKPVVDGRNVNQIWSNYLYQEKLGAYVRAELFSNKEEPTNLYTRLNWNIGPFDFDVGEIETSFPYIANAKDLWSSLFSRKKWNKEIYIHATFMESIERAFSTSFQEIGKAIQGTHAFDKFSTYQPLIHVLMEFPNDLGILTRYEVSAKLSTTSKGSSFKLERDGEKLEGSFEGDIRIEGRATATIGFLFREKKLSTRSLIEGSLHIDASGKASFDVSQQDIAAVKLQESHGNVSFTQRTEAVEGENVRRLSSAQSVEAEESFLSFLGIRSRIHSSGYRLSEVARELQSHTFLSALNFGFLLPPSLEERSFYISSELGKTLEILVIRDPQKNFTRLEMISDLKGAKGFDHREKGGHNKEHIAVTLLDCDLTTIFDSTNCRGKFEASNPQLRIFASTIFDYLLGTKRRP